MGFRNPTGPQKGPQPAQMAQAMWAANAAMFGLPYTPKTIAKDIAAEPIVATRAWRVSFAQGVVLDAGTLKIMADRWDARENPFTNLIGPRLTGVGHRVPWGGPIVTAICAQGASDHEAPCSSCACGFWGMKGDVHQSLLGFVADFGYVPLVIGTVRMWGKVYEHQNGYRGQYAQPIELTLYNGTEKLAGKLREFYACTVETK